jgi:C4-type Zn-finger protein
MNKCPFCEEHQESEDLKEIDFFDRRIIKTYSCWNCEKEYNEHYLFSHKTDKSEKLITESKKD